MDIITVWCGASFLPLSFLLFCFHVHSDAPSPQNVAETFSNSPSVPDSRSRPECACAIGQRGSVQLIFSLCLLDGHAQGPYSSNYDPRCRMRYTMLSAWYSISHATSRVIVSGIGPQGPQGSHTHPPRPSKDT